jgi:hypothetical protein
MSFDIFFQPCRYGGKPVTRTNPFTGKEETVLPKEPLTAAELKAVRRVLKRVQARGPDSDGCYVVESADGGAAEVFGSDLANGCMVALRGLTPGILQFLLDLLHAGKWVMYPAMEDVVAVTTSPEHMWGMPDDFPEVVTCNSADELGALLSDGFGAWKKYRDRVVRERGAGGARRGRK